MSEQGRRWVRVPANGQYRGEGEWVPYTDTDEIWERLRATSYLPTWEGAEPPTDEEYAATKEPKP